MILENKALKWVEDQGRSDQSEGRVGTGAKCKVQKCKSKVR